MDLARCECGVQLFRARFDRDVTLSGVSVGDTIEVDRSVILIGATAYLDFEIDPGFAFVRSPDGKQVVLQKVLTLHSCKRRR